MSKFRIPFLLTLCCTVLAALGCSLTHSDPAAHGTDLIAKQGAASPDSHKASTAGSQTPGLELPGEVITLPQALSLALTRNPTLAAFSLDIRAAEARTLQASLRPNPEAELEIEHAPGTGNSTGFESAETTLRIGQLIELGGKRAKRTRLASLEGRLRAWDYESEKADVFRNTARAFVEVLAAQERLALADKTRELAARVAQVVAERVKTGKTSPVEETRARIALTTAQTDLLRAKQEMESSRKRLAANWGSASPEFGKVMGDFEALAEIPSLAALVDKAAKNPDWARWASEADFRYAAIELEKSKRTPSPRVFAGVQRFEDDDELTATFGLSVPLLIFDRNQGGTLEAQHALAKSLEERRAAEVRITSELGQAYEALSSSHRQAAVLKSDILPSARQVFEATQEGYEKGKFGYLDVLDTQRTLFEVQGRYIDALAAYHAALADIERLMGGSLDSITKEQ